MVSVLFSFKTDVISSIHLTDSIGEKYKEDKLIKIDKWKENMIFKNKILEKRLDSQFWIPFTSSIQLLSTIYFKVWLF